MAALKTLLENLDVTVVRGTTELDVPDVVYDSRKITKGCLFICIEGANFDGHSAAAQAVEKGAAVLVTQKEVDIPADAQVTVLKVENTRYAMAFISAAWFGILPAGEDYRNNRNQGKDHLCLSGEIHFREYRI